MPKQLKLARGLALPLEVAGEATGILATRGAGKSFASAVLIEELHAAGIQLAVLDPTGVYWGLRASASGEPGGGLPIVVLGGPHGDVPLEPTAGALIADLLVDTGQSLVLDLSDFPTKGNQTRFVTDFAERLYRRKARARETLHLVVDEADEFAPQRPMRDEARMLGAMEALVRRGRSRGIGVTLITQRSAALNKNVLDLIDTLLVMRMLGPRAAEVVKGWIAQKELRDEVGILDELSGLPTGTAWVWSPVRDVLKKVQVRRIKTFDSYATPKPGETRIEPKALRKVDLEKLGEQIQATAEKAKADDPTTLKRRVRELEHDLAQIVREPAEQVVQEVEKIVEVEVPVFEGSELAALEDAVAHLRSAADQVEATVREARRLGEKEAAAAVGRLEERRRYELPRAPTRGNRGGKLRGNQVEVAAVAIGGGGAGGSTMPPASVGSAEELPPAPRALLNVLVQFEPEGRTRKQLAVLAGYSAKSSTFRNALGRLRTLGFVTPANMEPIHATPEGVAACPHVDPLPVGRELYEHWYSRLAPAPRALLEVLYMQTPPGVGREELAEASGYSSTSSTFRNALGRLRTLDLATPANVEPVRAADELYQ